MNKMKITKQRLKKIIKEEFEDSKKKGMKKYTQSMKYKDKEEEVPFDVERSLDYFFRLVNNPEEVFEFMSLLDDALIAATEEGKLGSVDNVKRAIVNFIQQIAPRVSVNVSTVDLTEDEESEE